MPCFSSLALAGEGGPLVKADAVAAKRGRRQPLQVGVGVQPPPAGRSPAGRNRPDRALKVLPPCVISYYVRNLATGAGASLRRSHGAETRLPQWRSKGVEWLRSNRFRPAPPRRGGAQEKKQSSILFKITLSSNDGGNTIFDHVSTAPRERKSPMNAETHR